VRVNGVTGGYGARVTLVEPLGKETLVYLNYAAEHLLIAVADPSIRVTEGASLEFDLNGGRLYLFDIEGRRLV
jgi:hypothetical protein